MAAKRARRSGHALRRRTATLRGWPLSISRDRSRNGRGAFVFVVIACLLAGAAFQPSTQGAKAAPAGAGNANLHLNKTISGASFRPTVELTLGVNRSTAIPGDQLKYSATLTNIGATLVVSGDLFASNTQATTATLAAYWDEVATSSNPGRGCSTNHGHDTSQWPPFAGAAASQHGYVPVVPPPIAAGVALAVTPVPSAGVTYPSTGDKILGTTLSPGKRAQWHYVATLQLSPAQSVFLTDPTQVTKMRNTWHVEVAPRNANAAQPAIVDVCSPGVFGLNPSPSGTVRNASISVQPPTGSPIVFTSATTASLASLAPGASVTVSGGYKVPVPAAKAAGETDGAYLARLKGLEGSTLKATATAQGTASSGTVTAPQASAKTTEHLPIVFISKSGPAKADAGTTATYSLPLSNMGGATAGPLAVTDSVPDGSTGTVTNVPPNLTAGASGIAQATFAIPSSQPAGPLADTAAVMWQDANLDNYGPVSAIFTTQITNSLLGASLVLSPASAGPDVTGTTQALQAALKDKNGHPIANQAIAFAVTGANPRTASASTDATGVAKFSYSGANPGNDMVQATATSGSVTLQSNTATVGWVTPLQTVSTTAVQGTFFPGGAGSFTHKPGDTPAFTQTFPTIDFNPPGGTIPGNNTGVGVDTRPFTDITTDVVGNFNGSVVAQGNGVQAGLGNLFTFDAVFTANYVVATPGNVTFNFYSDDGFIFGAGGGATRVAGPLLNAPTNTPFQNYPVMGAYNAPTSPVANSITVNFPKPGIYPYEVDYSECCGGQISMTMGTSATGHGVTPTGDLSLSPGTPTPTVGQATSLTLTAMDASGTAIPNLPVVLTVSGPNSQQVNGKTDATGVAKLSYVGQNAGTDLVLVGASISGSPEVSNVVNLTWTLPAGGTQPPPIITNPTPADGSEVTKPTPVSATFRPPTGDTIKSWSLAYQALDPEPPVTIASGNGTPPSPLGTFDPTLVANGTYNLIFTATSQLGAVQTLTSTVFVAGNLKPGRYVTTYQDLVVPVNGYQMEVRRTYDSIDKRPTGDFGTGWHVSVSNFAVSANRQLGAGGWTEYPTQCVIGLCFWAFKTTAPHYVTVTFPDGHDEVFDFTPQGGAALFYFQGSAGFTARAGTGTTSTLAAVGDQGLTYGFDGNLYGSDGQPYNPTRFQLTTRDGQVLILDVNSGLVSQTDPNGNSLSIDENGVHASNGQSITFSRDAAHGNRITSIAGPLDGVTGQNQHLTYGYDTTTGELRTVTDPNNNTVTYTYDPTTGNLKGGSGLDGAPVETVTYGLDGRVATISYGNQPPLTIATSPNRQQITVIDSNKRLTTLYTLDDLGDTLAEDQLYGSKDLKTTYTYDGVGRVTGRTDPLGHKTAIQYDESLGGTNGNVLTYTDASQRTWKFQNYNAFGQVGQVLAPDNSIRTIYGYDSHTGNLLTEQQPGANAAVFTYYPDGMIKSFTDAGGRQTAYTYDSNGYLHTVQDSTGRGVTYTDDAAGRVLNAVDQVGHEVDYGYDGLGDVTSITDPSSNKIWTFHYNAFGRLDQAQDPTGEITSYAYNDLLLVKQRTDRNHATTTYAYDTHGRLTQEVRPGNDITNFQYDPLERLTETDNASSELNFVYDDAGNLMSQTSCAPQPSRAPCAPSTSLSSQPTVALGYSYFDNNAIKTSSGPDGTTTYDYDSLNRLATVQDAAHQTFTFGYDPLSRLASTLRPNGANDTITYDSSNDLKALDTKAGTSTVSRADYGIDNVTGRVSSLTDPAGTNTFSYYDNGALHTATHPTASSLQPETYTYDNFGNRTSGPNSTDLFTYDNVERLSSDGSNIYTFDGEGDLRTKKVIATGATTTYNWNADHQLLSIQYADGTRSTYKYDPFGRRIETVDNGTTTRFVWDGANLHSEYDGMNGLLTAYTTTPTTNLPSSQAPPNPPIAPFGTQPGQTLEVSAGGQHVYPLHDGLGNVTALTNSSGSVTASFAYDAYGRPAATNSAVSRSGFTGYQYDRASGLYYAHSRYYDPTVGRFISEDPILSPNRYAYAYNDPTNLVDPTGADAAGEYSIELSEIPQESRAALETAQATCRALSFSEALLLAIQFAGDAAEIVSSSSGWQFIWQFNASNGNAVTLRAGLDVNPTNSNVIAQGEHLNLQTQINGNVVKSGPLADPHTPIDPSIEKVEYPGCRP